jgi:hypothetical protein
MYLSTIIEISEVILLFSAMAFIVTSVLWVFFSKPFKVLHYTSLVIAAAIPTAWVLIGITLDSTVQFPDYCRYTISDSRLVTSTLAIFTAIYSFIGIIVAIFRKFLRLRTKVLAIVCLVIFLPASLAAFYIQMTISQEKAAANCDVNKLIPAPPTGS